MVTHWRPHLIWLIRLEVIASKWGVSSRSLICLSQFPRGRNGTCGPRGVKLFRRCRVKCFYCWGNKAFSCAIHKAEIWNATCVETLEYLEMGHYIADNGKSHPVFIFYCWWGVPILKGLFLLFLFFASPLLDFPFPPFPLTLKMKAIWRVPYGSNKEGWFSWHL